MNGGESAQFFFQIKDLGYEETSSSIIPIDEPVTLLLP
jgi:hypothetical protein